MASEMLYCLIEKVRLRRRRANRMNHRKSAFTLVEIVVVIACLSLLALMGSVAVTRAIKKSRINKAKTEIEILAAAMRQLAWDTGRIPNKNLRTNPGSKEIWDISVNAAGLMGNDGDYPNWKGPYYEGAIEDPWGKNYFYDPDYVTNGIMRPAVGSFGPNKVGRNRYDSDDICILLDE